MRRYNLLALTTMTAVALIILAGTASAQYWFQSGVRGSTNAAFNNGASVAIQTVYQNATIGSMGFWIGETLSNGAFIQVGYEITNATGYYSTSCGGSPKSTFLQAGTPAWFWEYFTPNFNNNSFCGGIGPNGSAGINGSYNTYSFRSFGNTWNAYFNNQQIGSVNLGASNSGPNPPSAYGEYADTNTNSWPMQTVRFRNLAFYTANFSRLVTSGYGTISYGKGSLTYLPNNYGVQEVGNFINYFEVGSHVAPQKTQLWQLGYQLTVASSYGNITGTGNYVAYSLIPLSVPRIMNLSPGVRELFTGWVGWGVNSYTGNNTNPYISMYGNVTETATWKRQYYLNASTTYGKLAGVGWYDANSNAAVYLNSTFINIGHGSRAIFNVWSDGDVTNGTVLYMNAPRYVSASWNKQYYLNVVTTYGSTAGSGWYNANSTADISLDTLTVPINGSSRYQFSGWSNGNTSTKTAVTVKSPATISALFDKQYLVLLAPQNSYGQNISEVNFYNISSQPVNSNSVFLFAQRIYNIEYLNYKGVLLSTNQHFSVNSPTVYKFKTPVYNIVINTKSVFGDPVNATVNVTFKNNTKIGVYSGSNGTVTLRNVPYGYVSGYADYLGLREGINLANGQSAYLVFVTSTLIYYIVGGILVIIVIAKIGLYYENSLKAKIKPRRK